MTTVYGIDPRTGDRIEPGYRSAGRDEVAELCARATNAFVPFRETSLDARAAFLEMIAGEILNVGEPLIETAVRETGLPRARLEGERGRTVGQLRLFAGVVRDGGWIGARIDPAQPDRTPQPRPDLRLRHVALGPVAVFGASNFPLAFSVAGGDTASALAAGCPVIVKAHPAHPGTSQLVADAILAAVARSGMPEGTFSMFHSADNDVAAALVADPRIKAVGFTGSRAGGLALAAIAARRREPIPVFAEMSSVNPVIVFPAALASRGAAIARDYAASLTMGVGQFCTNPGLTLVLEGAEADVFLGAAGEAIGAIPAATMLTPGIHAAHAHGAARLASDPAIQEVARGQAAVGPFEGQAGIYLADADAILAAPDLVEEVFGPTGLVVRCRDLAQLRAVIAGLEGQLTIAIHIDPADHDAARALLPLLEQKAGRILVNGFGTGVEVSHAMVHGGPFPATTDGRSTSVGSLAITRFLRPVCYQDMPENLLPSMLRDGNIVGIPHLLDGKPA